MMGVFQLRSSSAKTSKWLLCILALTTSAQGCPKCRPLVMKGVLDASFGSNLFMLALPLTLVGLLGVALYFAEPLAARVRGTR